MASELNINPTRALEFIHSFMGNSIRRAAINRQSEARQLRVQENNPSPSDHGRNARRIAQNAQPLNYQSRFINLLT